MLRLGFACALFAASAIASAAENNVHGRISNLTFLGDSILIQIDSGLPTNCAGTSYGWIGVPASSKPMQAFLIGVWLRGDVASTEVVVYTAPVDSTGYCHATQIDPVAN